MTQLIMPELATLTSSERHTWLHCANETQSFGETPIPEEMPEPPPVMPPAKFR